MANVAIKFDFDADEKHRNFLAALPEAQRTSHMLKIMQHHSLIDQFTAITNHGIHDSDKERLFAMLARAFFLSEGQRMAFDARRLDALLDPWVKQSAAGEVISIMRVSEIEATRGPLGASPIAVLQAAAFGISMWSKEPRLYPAAIEVIGISISSMEGSHVCRLVLGCVLENLQPGFGVDEIIFIPCPRASVLR